MKFIPDDIAVDFMGLRKKAFLFSGVLVFASLAFVLIFGLNKGIDFNGGSSLIVAFDAGADADDIRSRLQGSVSTLVEAELAKEAGTAEVSVQDFSAGVDSDVDGKAAQRFLVYTEVTSLIDEAKVATLRATFATKFGEGIEIYRPSKDADIFYVTYPQPAEIKPQQDLMRAALAELGYSEVELESDTEKQLRINEIEEFNMLLEERRAEGDAAGEGGDDLETRRALAGEKISQQLTGKFDTRFTLTVGELKSKVAKALALAFPAEFLTVESSTSVSASVGEDLLNDGLLAILYAIIGILIYITMRFDFRFAPGAVVALVHDVLITMGIFAAFQIKFTLPIIAALLTIVGYSLNDTIVVLDRVRETFEEHRGRDLYSLLNRAINATLSRTVLTSLTTLFVVVAILVSGGGLIFHFALALCIGVIIGTYSSIFVASPLVYYMDHWLAQREEQNKSGLRGGAQAKA